MKAYTKKRKMAVLQPLFWYICWRKKIIDGAILTGRGREREEDDWMPFPKVAKSKEEIISAAGTK